jgi:hypothetical protein
VGVLGSFERTCTGAPRDWSGWQRPLARVARPVRVLPLRGRGRLPRLVFKHRPQRAAIRWVLAAARTHGYVPGAHCLGGAYAVAPDLLHRRELLDWRPWVGTRLGEDVVLGLLCHAAGLRMAGLVDEGDPFALAWRGLPGPPPWLLERRHAIVHSVKDDPDLGEAQLRAWFRRRRPEVAA